MGDSTNQPQVARYDEAPGHSDQYLDTVLPGCSRTVYNLIGTNVGAAADSEAAVPPEEFNLCVVEAEPDNGAGLHDHETVEVFMPLKGRWEITYNDDGEGPEESVVLEPYDTIQVPVGVFRGFRNVSEESAHLLAITGGEDPGRVTWPDSVVEEAEKRGRMRDDEGTLVEMD